VTHEKFRGRTTLQRFAIIGGDTFCGSAIVSAVSALLFHNNISRALQLLMPIGAALLAGILALFLILIAILSRRTQGERRHT